MAFSIDFSSLADVDPYVNANFDYLDSNRLAVVSGILQSSTLSNLATLIYNADVTDDTIEISVVANYNGAPTYNEVGLYLYILDSAQNGYSIQIQGNIGYAKTIKSGSASYLVNYSSINYLAGDTITISYKKSTGLLEVSVNGVSQGSVTTTTYKTNALKPGFGLDTVTSGYGITAASSTNGPVSSGTTITPNALASQSAIGAPALTQSGAISATGLASTSVIGSPTLSGAGQLQPTALASATALGSPSIAQASTLSPTGLVSATAIQSPAITSGKSITPAALVSSTAIGQPGMAQSTSLAPAGLVSGSAMQSPAIQGQTQIAAAGLVSATAMGSPSIETTQIVVPSGLVSPSRMGAPGLIGTTDILAQGLVCTSLMGSPTIVGNAVFYHPELIVARSVTAQYRAVSATTQYQIRRALQ